MTTFQTRTERILLWPNGAPDGNGNLEESDAALTLHRPQNPSGTAIIICPGGGYAMLCMEPEGHGIARWLNESGITGIVLEYRLPHGRSFVPLIDAQHALQVTREYSQAWNIGAHKIGILGFSAGGHLAATAGTHFENLAFEAPEKLDVRPDFMALIYPVISMREKTHSDSRKNLLGDAPDAEFVALFSNETQVTKNTPPTFLTHAADDTAVDADNSREFFAALQNHGVASEYLELPSGGHGLNGYQGEMWEAWKTALLNWLKKQNFTPAKAS